MKRSRSIELALMGSVPFLLAACEPPPAQQASSLLYQNLQQCVSAGQVSADVCAKAYADAVQAQLHDAPRYGSLGECEAQFGYDQCHAVTNASGHWFMPALAGFLVGRALSHPGYDRRPDLWYGGPGGYGYGGYGGWGGQPIYHARGDRAPWRMADGERFGWGARGPGGQSVAETLSRGGFGLSGAARGSWGG